MTKDRPHITPEILNRFRQYHKEHGAWGNLHVVLDDRNLEDKFVQHCVNNPFNPDDKEGIELARILLGFTKTQRGRIANEC